MAKFIQTDGRTAVVLAGLGRRESVLNGFSDSVGRFALEINGGDDCIM